MSMEFVFIIGMAVLLILCVKVKANAFISLLATALVMGLLSGMSGADTVAAITGGFSGTVKSIGIVIIFGIMLGNYLDAAKGTNRTPGRPETCRSCHGYHRLSGIHSGVF